MPPPDRTKVAIQALREDASQWDRWSGHLRDAAQVAGELTLTVRELSRPGEWVGLTASYAEIQHLAQRRALAGAAVFQAMAAALRGAANDYDRADIAAASRLGRR